MIWPQLLDDLSYSLGQSTAIYGMCIWLHICVTIYIYVYTCVYITIYIYVYMVSRATPGVRRLGLTSQLLY